MSEPGDMRIIVNGQQAFGRAVLEALLERGENVVGVYTAPDGDGPPDPLKVAAVERGLPLLQPRSFSARVGAGRDAGVRPGLVRDGLRHAVRA